MTITGPTDAIFKAFAMIAYKFEEVRNTSHLSQKGRVKGSAFRPMGSSGMPIAGASSADRFEYLQPMRASLDLLNWHKTFQTSLTRQELSFSELIEVSQ